MPRSPQEETLPVYAAELVRQLDEEYPHKCPQPGDSAPEMWMYSGKRELIDALLSKLKETEDTFYNEL